MTDTREMTIGGLLAEAAGELDTKLRELTVDTEKDINAITERLDLIVDRVKALEETRGITVTPEGMVFEGTSPDVQLARPINMAEAEMAPATVVVVKEEPEVEISDAEIEKALAEAGGEVKTSAEPKSGRVSKLDCVEAVLSNIVAAIDNCADSDALKHLKEAQRFARMLKGQLQ